MTDSDFLPLREVERFLTYNRPDIREIVLELRDLVWQVCPYATERILWGSLSYHNSAKGGPVKGAICQIEIEKDRIRLADSPFDRWSNPLKTHPGMKCGN